MAKNQPFLSQMHYAFATVEHVNLILGKLNSLFVKTLIKQIFHLSKQNCLTDYADGGDLGKRLEHTKRFSLHEVRLCAAEILLALKFLHGQKICYRDLKTENVLIDKHGHMILTDFGLACQIEDSESLHGVCGTYEYMAPGL